MKTAAKAAKLIKKILKAEYPDTKFSVTSDNFAGGNSVRVSWDDGAPSREIKRLVDHFQYGEFDGMRDIYEYTNGIEDLPQVKYVNYSRSWSDETKQELFDQIRANYGLDEDTPLHRRLDELGGRDIRQAAFQRFAQIDFTKIDA